MKKSIIITLGLLTALCLTACGGPKEATDMSFSTTIGGEVVSGLFTGTVEGNKPNGQGTFQCADNSMTYSGNWEDGSPAGEGKLEYSSYTVTYLDNDYTGKYEGESLDGLPNGNGSFSSEGDEIIFKYSGEWINGTIAGNGRIEVDGFSIDYDGDTLKGHYCGEISGGVPDGTGEFVASESDKELTYSGGWHEGKMSGSGTLDYNSYTVQYKDGVVRVGHYSGETLDGIASGEGTFSTANDFGVSYSYTGSWENGIYNGYGQMCWDTDDAYARIGTFVDGEFTPTPVDFFVSKGTYPDKPYSISDNALEFLEKYPDEFLNNDVSNGEIEYEKDFKYKAFAKNPNQFGTKLITVSNLRVVQIFENADWGKECSFIIAEDGSNNVYYINIFGYWENVYEGTRITLTALPLDYFTYPNTYGNKIWAIPCAGVKIN